MCYIFSMFLYPILVGSRNKRRLILVLFYQVKTEVTRLDVEIKTAKRNTKKTEDKLASLKTEKTELETSMTNMTEVKSKIELDAKEVSFLQ